VSRSLRQYASAHDANTMAYWFGLIPTEMRQYVHHAIALPASTDPHVYPTETHAESVLFVDQARLHDVVAAVVVGVGRFVAQKENNYWYMFPSSLLPIFQRCRLDGK
jgi:hypothetical protein